MQIHNKQNGFTIVETLVAIAVLMIAIAGPLVIASKGLTAALYSKDQMIATFLAQESMEVIKNIRDKELNDGDNGDWLSGFTPASCTNGNLQIKCDADPFVPNMINNCSAQPGNEDGCPIYYDIDKGYTSQSGGGNQTTIFKRRFYFESISGDNDQKIAHVIVKWKVGTIPFETEITSLLTSQLR